MLSEVHEKAALEVFDKDCLIKLGACIAPIYEDTSNNKLLDYEIKDRGEVITGTLKIGEIVLFESKSDMIEIKMFSSKGVDLGCGKDGLYSGKLTVGEVGIMFDGRGRSLKFSKTNKIEQIVDWSSSTKEYPS